MPWDALAPADYERFAERVSEALMALQSLGVVSSQLERSARRVVSDAAWEADQERRRRVRGVS